MQRLCLGGEIVQVPAVIVEQESLFRTVISRSAFDSLSIESRIYLRRFLPRYPNWESEESDILDCAFSDDPNFYFGNPVSRVHSKIQGGWFNPERPSDQVQLRDNARVLYDHYIRHYYISLLRKLLITRRKLIEKAKKTGALDPIVDDDKLAQGHAQRHSHIRLRAAKRARLMIAECREKVGESGAVSSDDEDDPSASRIFVAAAGHSTLYSPRCRDLDLHQPLHLSDLKEMMKEYQRLKSTQSESPSLDVSDVNMDGVLERAGIQVGAHPKAKPSVKSSQTIHSS